VVVKDSGDGELVMYGEVEAEEEGGSFRVKYDEGRYDSMEVSGAVVQKARNGLYVWTHEEHNGRRVYKQEGVEEMYLYHLAVNAGGSG
jgi:hypothetical protein